MYSVFNSCKLYVLIRSLYLSIINVHTKEKGILKIPVKESASDNATYTYGILYFTK